MHKATQSQTTNEILAALSGGDYERLAPHLEAVKLSHGEVIYESGAHIEYLYFPFNSLISLVTQMVNGDLIEVGLVGREGMSGITALMGVETAPGMAIVQVPDSGARVKIEVIREEFGRGGELQSLLLRYTQAFIRQVSQTAACNAMHTVEERLGRWLLMCQDRVQADDLPLTQQFLSEMLGARRATVSTAASAMQVEGLIHYRRGHIRIVDRPALESFACECYAAGKDEPIH